jgi:hypothetical protein
MGLTSTFRQGTRFDAAHLPSKVVHARFSELESAAPMIVYGRSMQVV